MCGSCVGAALQIYIGNYIPMAGTQAEIVGINDGNVVVPYKWSLHHTT